MSISAAKAARVTKWAALEWNECPDPRKARGKRHGQAGLLNLLVAAMACGKKTLRGAEHLADDLDLKARKKLGCGQPSDTTLDRLVRAQDPTGLAAVLRRQVREGIDRKVIQNDLFPVGVATMDGKAVWVGDEERPECQKCARDDGSPYWMLFAQRVVLTSSKVAPCLLQRFIGDKTNETAQFQATFEQLCEMYGPSFEVLTHDAGANSRHNADLVHKRDKGYLFAIKENQPGLLQAARTHLGCKAMPGDAEQRGELERTERYKGKSITRSFFRVAFPEGEVEYPGAKELWRVRQTATNAGGVVALEDRYFVVNRRWSAEHALALVRLHWGIENGSNWTLDVVLREDAGSPCTRGKALVVLSYLRLLAANLLAMWRSKLPPEDNRPVAWARAAELLRDALRAALPPATSAAPLA